jgi:hypothetical protein
VPGHSGPLAEEARAEHVVGAPAGHRREHALEVVRGVLAVAVEVDGSAVPLVAGELEAGAERGAEPARGFVRDDPRAERAADRGRGVARAVVHEQPVDGHAAGRGRDAAEHVADRSLLVAGNDDREAAAARRRRLDRVVGGGHERAAARRRRLERIADGGHERAATGRGRGLEAEEPRDRGGHFADRALLAPDRAGVRPRSPDHERHGTLAPVEVAMAADAATLAVVRHEDHGGMLELAPLLEEAEELADAAVRLGELVEVLRAANAADVAELVGGEQLQYEQVRVLLLDHAAGLRAQRSVDLGGRLHRGDGTDHLIAERVEQVGDPDQPAAPPLPGEHVEDRLDPHSEPRREVRPHAVLGRRGAGQHR